MIIPKDDNDWDCVITPRTEIAVWRQHVLADSLREGHKRRFDPKQV